MCHKNRQDEVSFELRPWCIEETDWILSKSKQEEQELQLMLIMDRC